MRRGLIALLLALTQMAFGATHAWAHASLLGAQPADGAVLSGPPASVELRFNEPVSPLAVTLFGPDGGVLGATASSKDETLEVRFASPPPRGTNVLSYRVISADGHPVGGSLSFSVGEPSRNAAEGRPQGDAAVTLLIRLTRMALYAALFLAVGGAFFRRWIEPPRPANGADRLAWSLGVVGLPLALAAFGLQGLDALGLPLGRIADPAVWAASWSTAYATTVLLTVVALLLALTAQWASPLRGRDLPLMAMLTTGAALAASGHASAAEPRVLMGSAVYLHAIAIAFWAGALPPLFAAARRGGAEFAPLLRRFSTIAVPVVGLLALSGGALAFVQLGQVSSLWTTDYGLLLTAKLCLVGLLLGLAALNRFWLTPAIEQGGATAALRRSMASELVLMLAIFAVAAGWRFTPPPRALLQAAAEPAHMHLHTAAAMVDVTLTPGRAGPVRASLYFQTGDFTPLTPKEVTIAFSLPDRGVEPIERRATLGPDGNWRTEPAFLPQPGIWTVRIEALIDDFDKAIIQDRVKIDR